MVDNVFVIGDVHGNLNRLEALLKQEGLLVWCKPCEGSGTWADDEDCLHCGGLGWARARLDVTVVQLGDLGHFGHGGSPTGDLLCYKYVTENRWCDVVLWGNHDRALVDHQHAFSGFEHPRDGTVLHFITMLHDQGRMQTAFDAHGFLLTHAGLAAAFKHQKTPDEVKSDLEKFVDWINDSDEDYLIGHNPRGPMYIDKDDVDWEAVGIINAIGVRRGGGSKVGGILWRDIEEGLYNGFRQIFGHSADSKKHMVRVCSKSNSARFDPAESSADAFAELVGIAFKSDMKPSYCIDVGGKPGRLSVDGKNPNCLAGIWLPSERIVRVDL